MDEQSEGAPGPGLLPPPIRQRWLLTGASGMVGQALVAELRRRGAAILVAGRAAGLTKSAADEKLQQIIWNPAAPVPFIEASRLEGVDIAVHLSGANLAAQRWSPSYKREIVESRTRSTAALAGAIARITRPPAVLIAASATGIYGDRGDEQLTEEAPPGDGFLSETCQAWEAATRVAEAAGIRIVHLRLGVVLGRQGGALAKVLPLFRAGLGGRLGSGSQWMSWITLGDAIRAVLHVAGDSGEAGSPDPRGASLSGAVNCVSPGPVTNREYTRALGTVLGRPTMAMAPAFALRLAMGEMADAALLSSCRAVPQKLLASGFVFQDPEIEQALRGLLRS